MLLRSLRVRLTLWYVLLLAVILAAFSAGIYLTLRHSLNANLNDSIESRSDDLLDIIYYQRDVPTLAERVAPETTDLGESVVRVYDMSGGLTFDTSPPVEHDRGETAAVKRALAGATDQRTITLGDIALQVHTVPIRQEGQIVGALEVGESREDVSDTLQTLLLILAVSYPVTLAVASLGGLFLAGRALSPIDTLTRTARRISAEDLGQRLDLHLPDDEVGRLARTFDDMIARLDASFRRQRQFTADASHELRTPLTVMKGQIDVALQRDRDVFSYRQVLAAVNEEVDRLIRLVASLLTLARADAGQTAITLEEVALPDLVAGALEQLRPLAAERQVTLEAPSEPAVSLRADEDLLLQLLLNLLDNAVNHTPAGGNVSVGWRQLTGHVELWVRDTGAGIAAEDMPHIFERFYRADRARSRAKGGAGLGLAISRWIAEVHGGSITVESTLGQGSTFTVRLPQ